MESGWNALIVFGPLVAAAMMAIGMASAVILYECGRRGWTIIPLASLCALGAGGCYGLGN